jgi:uncharacterized protein YbaP (TraB family)
MKSHPILPRLALLFGLLLPGATALRPGCAAAATHHSVWKVEGKRSAVYLVGSVHVLKAENYPLPAEIEAAFTNSAIAAFETDIEAMQGPETQLKLMGKARLPEGETLAQQVSPQVYAAFTNHLNEDGLPVIVFDQFKPAMAAFALLILDLQHLGFDPKFGLDKHFFDRARKENKQIVALETVDFQIGLATQFSKEEAEAVMKWTMDDLDKLKQEYPDMLKAWQSGNSAQLEKMLNEGFQKVPKVFQRLVTDRNKRWLLKIEEWLQGDKNAVMIVGAGHLVGKEGVVELLRKKGLKVTQQ